MSVSIGELIVQADAAVSRLGHAPSTLRQYRWAWSEFEIFCSGRNVEELTNEVVDAFLQIVASDHREGRIKEWKRKLLRKSVLVLWEVSETGSYQWRLSRSRHPNDGLDAVFRPVQEQFEAWLEGPRLASTTRQLYASVSRRVLAWLPERGITGVGQLSGADVLAGLVFLSESYRPGTMRTAVSAVRVLCRFLEDTGCCAEVSRAIPRVRSRRVSPVGVLPARGVDELTNSPDLATGQGLRDRAMLLLGARTGLRPVDIAGLRLSDIDWAQAQITLTQQKTGTALRLPLLADVGEAIADYLLHGRPTPAADDHVFLRAQAPFTALSSTNGLYHVAAGAFARTGVVATNGAGRGFRVLRASLATRMLEEATLLPVISGALGHRGIDSAKHYLTADEKRMRACCLDFAGIEPTGAGS